MTLDSKPLSICIYICVYEYIYRNKRTCELPARFPVSSSYGEGGLCNNPKWSLKATPCKFWSFCTLRSRRTQRESNMHKHEGHQSSHLQEPFPGGGKGSFIEWGLFFHGKGASRKTFPLPTKFPADTLPAPRLPPPKSPRRPPPGIFSLTPPPPLLATPLYREKKDPFR